MLVHQAVSELQEEEGYNMEISITPSTDYKKRELGASDKIKAELAALREEAAAKQWTFEVGYTTAVDFAIEKITGLKPPANWLKQAALQNSMAQPLEDSKRIFLGQCVAGASKFNWADYSGVPSSIGQTIAASRLCETREAVVAAGPLPRTELSKEATRS